MQLPIVMINDNIASYLEVASYICLQVDLKGSIRTFSNTIFRFIRYVTKYQLSQIDLVSLNIK